jgi:DNA-binding response OmpR family regulator
VPEPTSVDPHVLIVEDDALLRETLIWALEDDGLEVAAAIDGNDAVQQATARTPGLVVLDMSLPGLDGFGVAAELRTRFGGQLPILVITADGQPRQKAERVGAYAYLHKPFDVDMLVKRVREGMPPAPRQTP